MNFSKKSHSNFVLIWSNFDQFSVPFSNKTSKGEKEKKLFCYFLNWHLKLQTDLVAINMKLSTHKDQKTFFHKKFAMAVSKYKKRSTISVRSISNWAAAAVDLLFSPEKFFKNFCQKKTKFSLEKMWKEISRKTRMYKISMDALKIDHFGMYFSSLKMLRASLIYSHIHQKRKSKENKDEKGAFLSPREINLFEISSTVSAPCK